MVRRRLIESIIKEVLGPRDGVSETLNAFPLDEYLTGFIIPVDYYSKKREIFQSNNPDDELIGDSLGTNLEDENDDDFVIFTLPESDAKTKPQSFGIAFLCSNANPTLKICVTWGRYNLLKDNSWKREGFLKIIEIEIKKDVEEIDVYSEDEGKIQLVIQRIHKNSNFFFIIKLINRLEINDLKKLAEKTIFQPSIRVIIRNANLENLSSRDSGLLNFLYRNSSIIARGYMCSAIWKEIDYIDIIGKDIVWPDHVLSKEATEFLYPDVRSEFLPLYAIGLPSFSWQDRENVPVFSAYELSEMWKVEKIDNYLGPLIVSYENWIKENEAQMEESPKKYFDIYTELVDEQKEMLNRLKQGLSILKEDVYARLSFCFANRVIWLQNNWKNKEESFNWYPYQLAFILANIEPLVNEVSPYRDIVDLLWIPTGGGKTETYLALMAFTMAYRRLYLRFVKKNPIKGYGTAILSRYTLRLLAVQQFRRTLSMVTAAEFLRVLNTSKGKGWRPEDCDIASDFLYGSMRFSIGMWVGGALSPNHLRKRPYAAIEILKQTSNINEGEPAQVINCPACKSILAIPKSGLSDTNILFIHAKKNQNYNSQKNGEI